MIDILFLLLFVAMNDNSWQNLLINDVLQIIYVPVLVITYLFDFLIFWLWAYVIKVIPETRRAY